MPATSIAPATLMVPVAELSTTESALRLNPPAPIVRVLLLFNTGGVDPKSFIVTEWADAAALIVTG